MRHVILLSLVCVVGCGLPFGIEDRDLPMTVTDSDSYVMAVDSMSGRVTLEVPFTLTNASNQVLTMVHCGKQEPDFSRRTGGMWEIVPGGPEALCLTLTHVEPGEVFDGVAHLWWDGSATPGELAGTYRLHWGRLWAEYRDFDAATRTWGERLPTEALISNTFQVLEP